MAVIQGTAHGGFSRRARNERGAQHAHDWEQNEDLTGSRAVRLGALLLAAFGMVSLAKGQGGQPRLTGTVKAMAEHSLTVTDAKGHDVMVTTSDATKLLQTKDSKSVAPAAMTDVAMGDRVSVTGTTGDAADSLHALRVIIMKSADIAASHAADEAAWQKGVGGLVKSVDAAANSVTITSGATTVTVQSSAATKFSRYSGSSVQFEDAVGSTFGDVHPGDQLRARGMRSEDGMSIKADAIVTGSFRNFSGLLTAIDSTAGTVTLKDLATKKVVTVKVGEKSDVRRLPGAAAARFAARAAGTPVGPAGTTPGSSGAAASGPGGSERAGMDLSQMLSRLPTETLGSLKVGDAVMIVASQPAGDATQPTAVRLVAGVEPILQASPKGEMTLAPWSMGGGGGIESGGGGQ